VFGVSSNIQLVHGHRGSGCSGKYSMGHREMYFGFPTSPILRKGSGCSVKYLMGQREV
jgi:hypothetical protein